MTLTAGSKMPPVRSPTIEGNPFLITVARYSILLPAIATILCVLLAADHLPTPETEQVTLIPPNAHLVLQSGVDPDMVSRIGFA